MKRLVATLALALTLSGLSVPLVSAASPICGSYPEFRAYADNDQVGFLGVQCPQFTTVGFDTNFGDSADGFRGSDNDKLNSWRFYNSTGSTWCLVIFADADSSGTHIAYTLGSVGTYWDGDSVGSFNDKATSVEFWKKGSSACS